MIKGKFIIEIGSTENFTEYIEVNDKVEVRKRILERLHYPVLITSEHNEDMFVYPASRITAIIFVEDKN